MWQILLNTLIFKISRLFPPIYIFLWSSAFPCLSKKSFWYFVIWKLLSCVQLFHRLYSLWNFLGQNTRKRILSLLQGIFPTQGSNPGLPHCRWILYQLSYEGSPSNCHILYIDMYACLCMYLNVCVYVCIFLHIQKWEGLLVYSHWLL